MVKGLTMKTDGSGLAKLVNYLAGEGSVFQQLFYKALDHADTVKLLILQMITINYLKLYYLTTIPPIQPLIQTHT